MFSLEFMASNLLRPPPLTIMLGHCLQHQIIMSHIDSNKLPSLPSPVWFQLLLSASPLPFVLMRLQFLHGRNLNRRLLRLHKAIRNWKEKILSPGHLATSAGRATARRVE
jgi:hypothetical protein